MICRVGSITGGMGDNDDNGIVGDETVFERENPLSLAAYNVAE